jgi:hypothetical protein
LCAFVYADRVSGGDRTIEVSCRLRGISREACHDDEPT